MTLSGDEFLRALWPGSLDYLDSQTYGEVRTINPLTKTVYPSFFTRYESVLETARRVRDVHDVYVGVVPRIRKGSKAEDCVQHVTTLWADFDGKAHGGTYESYRALAAVELAPNIIVASGHGYHAYWLLDEAVPYEYAQRVMKGIERRHGSDHCSDLPRVLRLPNTLNHKDESPSEVRLLRCATARRHRIADFDGYIEEERKPIRLHSSYTAIVPDKIQTMLENDPGKGARSEFLMSAIVKMVMAGMDDQSIEAAIETSAAGMAKMSEKNRSWPAYIRREIEHARMFVED